MQEQFVPVKGFEGFYMVNRDGEIITLRNKNGKKYHKLKPHKDKDGYLRVRLYGNNKRSYMGVHKVVALTFIDNPNGYDMVNHKNYIRNDNHVDNLEWCNAKANAQWSHDHYKGARHKTVIKIDANGDVEKFKSLISASKATGVSYANICRCCKGRTKKAGGYVWKYEEDFKHE